MQDLIQKNELEDFFMNTEETVNECPKCRAVINFVCFIDSKTKEEVRPGFIEKGTMAGGPLSGTLRKYRCANGHEETNNNEEVPS